MAKYQVDDVVVEANSPEEAVRLADSGNILDPIAKGALLNYSDEIGGALAAVPASMQLGEPYSKSYAGIRDKLRERQKGFQARNPVGAPLLEATASLPTGIAGGMRIAGQSPSLSRMGGIGAGESGLAAHGAGEGNMLSQALAAVPTAGIGLALGLGGGIVGRMYDKFTGAQTLPQKLMTKASDADLLTPKTALTRAKMMGPEATPVDVGGEGAIALAQQVAGATPKTRAMAERALVSGRQGGQTQRLFDTIEDTTGIRPDYGLATEAIEEVAKRRSAEAKPFWDAVYESPMPLTETLDNALNQRIVKQAFSRAQEEASLTGRQLPNIFQANEKGELIKTGIAPDMEAWTMIKTHIDDVIRGNKSYTDELTGRPTKLGVSMLKFRDKLVKELKDKNQAYGPALDQWAGETEIINAIDDGRKILSSAQRVSDVQRLAKNMSKSEKEGYLSGAVESIREKMGAITGEAQTREFAFMQSPNFQSKLRAFLPEGKAGDKALKTLVDRLKTERRFKETGQKVIAGSQTQFRKEIQETLNPSSRIGSFAQEAATGGITSAVRNKVLNKIGKIAGGVPPETKERIAELIFQPGGTRELTRFLMTSGLEQAKINSLMDLTRQMPGAFGAAGVVATDNPFSAIGGY